jgi:hypothetical protein
MSTPTQSVHLPCVCMDLAMLARATSARTTCHPCSGAMCHPLNCPPISHHCHVSLPMHHCHITCMVVRIVRLAATLALYGLYRLYSHQILPIWKNEQIVIYFLYGVHWIPFKLHSVCIDEAYAHVFFEEIMSTLMFRPSWTHLGSWIQFWITPPH